MPSSQLAIVDSGSTYIVGPTSAIGIIAEMNGAQCYSLVPNQDPVHVSCESKFDAATIECDQPFFDLEFHSDGAVYRLTKEDLLREIDTSIGKVCIIRIQGNDQLPGWVLGDPFLTKYYAAFDFDKRRVGFALSHENSADICQVDLPLDLTYDHKTASEETNGSGSTSSTTPTSTTSTSTATPPPYTPKNYDDDYDEFVNKETESKGKDRFWGIAIPWLFFFLVSFGCIIRRRKKQREAVFEEIAEKHASYAAELELT
mmetsp:Transcript_13783/g.19872  ORF Transcript_13783/g.19872 Transcript_13783/m.19872 type:complete len:258 (+) Transcript_13783:1160-1933(+)